MDGQGSEEEAFRNIMIRMAAEDYHIDSMARLAVLESIGKPDDYDMTARFAELAAPILKLYCLTDLPNDSEAVFRHYAGSHTT